MKKAMSKEVGAGGRFDIFLNSGKDVPKIGRSHLNQSPYVRPVLLNYFLEGGVRPLSCTGKDSLGTEPALPSFISSIRTS